MPSSKPRDPPTKRQQDEDAAYERIRAIMVRNDELMANRPFPPVRTWPQIIVTDDEDEQ